MSRPIARSLFGALLVPAALAGATHAATPEPRVTLTLPGIPALSAEISGDVAAFVDSSTPAYNAMTWDYVLPPRALSSSVRYYRSTIQINGDIAAFHDYSDAGLELTVIALDHPGVEYVVSAGLNPDFQDFSIDGRCVSFVVFDPAPAFTTSVYRACLKSSTGFTRSEIDGNLVRSDNHNPIAEHNGVHAFGGDVLWTAGAFPPFVFSPLLWDGAHQRVTRLVTNDIQAVALNADTALLGEPIASFGDPNFLKRYDRRSRALTNIVSAPFYVQWVSLNERSEIAYNTDFRTGDNQRTYLYRPTGATVRVGPAGGFGSVLSDTTLAYQHDSEPRAYDLASGVDERLTTDHTLSETMRVSHAAVLWIGFDSLLHVSLPGSVAVAALQRAVTRAALGTTLTRTLQADLLVVAHAMPGRLSDANKALRRFINDADHGAAIGGIDGATHDALTLAATNILPVLADNEYGLCSDGRDNDRDGRTDCADADCAGDGACVEAFSCGDHRDNDRNGLVDCDDSDCADQAECTETAVECGDLRDNDHDGLVDCDDPDCASEARCIESQCDDLVDNDGDGDTDCDDSDCDFNFACYEFFCGDGDDNDNDGDTDCDDPDCAGDDVCQ